MTIQLATTGHQQGQESTGPRCLICHEQAADGSYDACDRCKARLFDEYVAVKGGL